jgi:hypothetical protein
VASVIRFLPDTWSDAVLRPIAMAAPDAGVYVEIMAPDVRFAVIAVLVLIWIGLAWRRRWRLSPAIALLMFMFAAFLVWISTSGNGRYFIPGLLAAGPLSIALIHRLPSTRSFSCAVAAIVVALQGFMVWQNNPWHSWQLAPWTQAPFFEVALDKEALTKPATYVTATSISYSLIASRFPAASRWVNISSQPDPDRSADGRRVQALLSASPSLRLLIPSVPDHVTSMGAPDDAITKVINGMIGRQRLALQDAAQCRLLPSRGLASESFRDVAAIKPQTLAKVGFWDCPLQYPVVQAKPVVNEGSPSVNRAFETVEKACPRLFPPGEALTSRTDGGYMRGYSSADMKLYVLDDGSVYYKYWRAMNPTLIGSTGAVLAESFKMDCNTVHGRSGLPWNRQL